MLDCKFMLTRILFVCSLLMVHCSQPNCTSVTDFDDCRGNVSDFCPNNIVCACKDGKPFCKCQNFRGVWGNYWYMGPKCDQLWNTLDLILVATLPGIGLALIVGVAIQITHYCKERSKKSRDHAREERSFSELRTHYNSAYDFDANRRRPQPNQGQVSTEIHLSNKLNLQTPPQREMPWGNQRNLGRLKESQTIKRSVIRRSNCTNMDEVVGARPEAVTLEIFPAPSHHLFSSKIKLKQVSNTGLEKVRNSIKEEAKITKKRARKLQISLCTGY